MEFNLAELINQACIDAGLVNQDSTPSKTRLKERSGVNNVAIAKMFDNDTTVKLHHVLAALRACGYTGLKAVK